MSMNERKFMIITRTPFRISFAGGGSDLESFYSKHEGCVLSAAINKYMYIMLHPSFEENTTAIKYSKTEIVHDINLIQHPIVKQVLLDYGIKGIEIASMADIPSGTGLASSSAFTVGLLHAANVYKGKFKSQQDLAEEACLVEINELGEPIGKQDQYGCALGGIKFIRFMQDGHVEVTPILLSKKCIEQLHKNLLMFYVGGVHNANEILTMQSKNVSKKDKFDNLIKMTELAKQLREALLSEKLDNFGQILNIGWRLKRELAEGITNPVIDKYYGIAIDNGAIGGKLLGAGGAGFLLFYCEENKQEHLRSALNDLTELCFDFDYAGTSIAYVGNRN
jgi:D-glycero-alpha-D-manno-heptose-7-phosphate kinase